MIKKIYAIRDEAIDNYSNHFYADNDKAAMRLLVPLVNNADSYMSIQPKDFSLWLAGSFDTDTGLLKGTDLGKPIFICEFTDLVNKEDK